MIKAKLTLYNIRKKPIISGYRPLFFIDGIYYSGAIFFDQGKIEPGETLDVLIDFASFNGQLSSGEIVKIAESPSHDGWRSINC